MNMTPGCEPPMLVAVEFVELTVLEDSVATVEFWLFTDTVKKRKRKENPAQTKTELFIVTH